VTPARLVALLSTATLVLAVSASAAPTDRLRWPTSGQASGIGADPSAVRSVGAAQPAGSPGRGGSGPAGSGPAEPQPHVAPFAGQLGGAVRTPGPSTGPVAIAEGTDGCDHAYGEVGQCVPWQFPPGVVDRCGWLAAHGFGPLVVHGRDRHGLDRNHDGVACGAGDT